MTAVAFSGSGRSIAVAYYGTTVRIFDAETGLLAQELKGHTGPARSVAFSRDDRSIASGSEDNVLRVWDAAGSHPPRELKGHTGPVTGVAFSDDGRRIVSGSADNTVLLWDAASGDPIWVMRGHTGRVSGVAFSADGSRVVSASDDASARVWDVATGERVMYLSRAGIGNPGAPYSLAFSRDGRKIALAGQFGAVRVWDTTIGPAEPAAPAETPAAASTRELGPFPSLTVGEPAPEFTVQRLDSGRLKLRDLRGKLVLINFWATVSPPSLAEMPAVQELHKTFAGDPRFELVGLACDEDIEAPRRFVTEKELKGTQAFSPSNGAGVASTYLVRSIPSSFLIGPDGRILAKDLHGTALTQAVSNALKDDGALRSREGSTHAPAVSRQAIRPPIQR